MKRQLRFTTELDALSLRVSSAARRPLCNPSTFEFRGNAEDRDDYFGEVRSGVDDRLRLSDCSPPVWRLRFSK